MRFVEKGASVVILDRDHDKGSALVAELGEKARFIKADVTSESEIQAALEFTVSEFGGLNTLINCAGVGIAIRTTSSRGPHPLDLFESVMRINLIGTFNVIPPGEYDDGGQPGERWRRARRDRQYCVCRRL